MQHSVDDVTEYLHAHIPITRHLGVRVTALDDTSVRMTAPLAPNLNHRETAFGGSIASLGILAGWTLAHSRMTNGGLVGRLVIQKSDVEYHLPIDGDFEVVCSGSADTDWDRFFRMLDRKGRGRIRLTSHIEYDNRTAATLHGTYVAMVGDSKDA